MNKYKNKHHNKERNRENMECTIDVMRKLQSAIHRFYDELKCVMSPLIEKTENVEDSDFVSQMINQAVNFCDIFEEMTKVHHGFSDLVRIYQLSRHDVELLVYDVILRQSKNGEENEKSH